MTPMIPVNSQKRAISAIHIPLDDPAAANAPLGRETESTSAQIGMTKATSAITAMIKPSRPKKTPVTTNTSCWGTITLSVASDLSPIDRCRLRAPLIAGKAVGLACTEIAPSV